MTEKRTRADCIADISIFTSNLTQIAKCVYDSIKERDMVSVVDCMHKFYAGYAAISALYSRTMKRLPRMNY